MRREYDSICNHCGKEIHPPRPPVTDDDEVYWRWLMDQMSQEQDCVWVERHMLREGRGLAHPLTNYICRDCDKLMDAWLKEGWREEDTR